MNTYAQYFAIERKLKNQGRQIERKELIADFTNGRTSSLRGLSPSEYQEFVAQLSKNLHDFKNSPENKMRQKVYALFVSKMGFSKDQMNSWCLKYSKAHKPLQEHNYQELIVLVHQVEQVFQSQLKSL